MFTFDLKVRYSVYIYKYGAEFDFGGRYIYLVFELNFNLRSWYSVYTEYDAEFRSKSSILGIFRI